MREPETIVVTSIDSKKNNASFLTDQGKWYRFDCINYIHVFPDRLRMNISRPSSPLRRMMKDCSTEIVGDRGNNIVALLRLNPDFERYDVVSAKHKAKGQKIFIFVNKQKLSDPSLFSRLSPSEQRLVFKDGQKTPVLYGLPCRTKTYRQGIDKFTRLIGTGAVVPKCLKVPLRRLFGGKHHTRSCLL